MVRLTQLLFVAAEALTRDIHLDASLGHDGNSGHSADDALRTPRAARDAARLLLKDGVGNVRVLVSGQHSMSDTLTLGPEDSGTIWLGTASGTSQQPSSSGRAAMHAGVQLPIDAFKPWQGSVWQLDLSAYPLLDLGNLASGGLKDCANNKTELFMNGQRMTLARYPNIGEDGYWQFLSAVNGTDDGSSITYGDDAKDRADKWASESDLWLHGYWYWDWADNYVKVQSVNTGDQTIEIDPTTRMDHGRAVPQARWYVVNALSELDAGGEYYIDRDARKLYFQPPGGKLDPSDVVVLSNLSAAIQVLNTTDIHFENIDVHYGKLFNIQLGADGLEVNDSSIVNCSVGAAGDTGVGVVGYRNRVADNLAAGTACQALSISGGSFQTLEPAGNIVEGNLIESFSLWKRTYQPGLGWGGVGSIYRRNTFRDGPHNAAWGSGNDNLFEENLFENCSYETSDTGAWYQWNSWIQRNNTLRRNVFKFIQNVVRIHLGSFKINAIYDDDQQSGNTIEDNEFYHCNTGIFIGGGRDHKIRGNKFVEVQTPIHMDDRGMQSLDQCMPPDGKLWKQMQAVNYTQPPYSIKYPELLNIDRPCVPVHNSIVDNVWCGARKGFRDFNDSTAQLWNVTLRNNTEQPSACEQAERIMV